MIYLAGIVGIVVFALGGFGAWEKHRADAAVAELSAVEDRMATCTTANSELTERLRGLDADVKRQADAAMRMQTRSSRALAEAAKQRADDEARIAGLNAVVNRQPTRTDGGTCARADATLRDLISGSVPE